MNRWTATDKRWRRKAVSRGSVVTPVRLLPICVTQDSGTPELWHSWGQEFSMATGKKSWHSELRDVTRHFTWGRWGGGLSPWRARGARAPTGERGPPEADIFFVDVRP